MPEFNRVEMSSIESEIIQDRNIKFTAETFSCKGDGKKFKSVHQKWQTQPGAPFGILDVVLVIDVDTSAWKTKTTRSKPSLYFLQGALFRNRTWAPDWDSVFDNRSY